MHEVLTPLLSDFRVRLVFTVDGIPGSPFAYRLSEHAASLGAMVVPWETAKQMTPDLTISPSSRGPVGELLGPLLITTHGPGLARDVSWPASGLVDRRRVEDETYVALPAESAGRRLASDSRLHPFVAGDPIWDSLQEGQRLRAFYRDQLGIHPGQRLVVISSTWGPNSLLARRPHLAEQLVTELPCDQYRVLVIMHANVWTGHGEWQINTWFAQFKEAGGALVPYFEGWRPAILSADAVVGDHGSVTIYSAFLGVPTIQDIDEYSEIDPASPFRDLAETTPKLQDGKLLRPQVEHLVDSGIADRYSGIRCEALLADGNALTRIRQQIYRILDLTPPHTPPLSAPRAVTLGKKNIESRRACAHVTRPEDDKVTFAFDFFPGNVEHTCAHGGWHCLLVNEEVRNAALAESADVVLKHAPDTGAESALHPHQAVFFEHAKGGTLLDEQRRRWRIRVVEGAPARDPIAAAAWLAVHQTPQASRHTARITCELGPHTIIVVELVESS